MEMYSNFTINENKLKEIFKNGTVTLDLSDEVNEMFDGWIKQAKLFGEKDKVKEYKQLKKFMKKNK